MKNIVKLGAVLAIAGAFAAATVTPGEARNGRWAAAGAGFAAGALTGAAIASANNGYYYGPGYYQPGYGPGYGAYAYQPGYVAGPAYGYGYGAPVGSQPGGDWNTNYSRYTTEPAAN